MSSQHNHFEENHVLIQKNATYAVLQPTFLHHQPKRCYANGVLVKFPSMLSLASIQLKVAGKGRVSSSLFDSEKCSKEKKSNKAEKWPLTAGAAMKLYRNQLTLFEHTEILDYPEIWYLGLEARKIEGVSGALMNNGYDDEQGGFIRVIKDHISYRYEIIDTVGKGSFGQVIKAYDHKCKEFVAIKVIRNKKRFHHQALVEVKILDLLRKKDPDMLYNIIHMKDYFYFRNHLCISFELLGINLYELLKKNNFQGFSLDLVRKFAVSILLCLRLLYYNHIIHCDLKPENILLEKHGSTSVKVIDFGSSCLEHQKVYSYIQSRFYRSPEVILGISYSTAIDMWSLGCILAELHTGLPIFPGENEIEQMACIMEIFGSPPITLVENSQRRRFFFDSKGNPRAFTNSKGKKRWPSTKDLNSSLKSNDPLFIDFIQRCFEWDPSKRMNPDEALQHSWLSDVGYNAVSSSCRLKYNTVSSPSHLNAYSAESEKLHVLNLRTKDEYKTYYTVQRRNLIYRHGNVSAENDESNIFRSNSIIRHTQSLQSIDEFRNFSFLNSNTVDCCLPSDKVTKKDVLKTMSDQINLSNWSIRDKDNILPPIR